MPVPTNTSPATAIQITSLPFTAHQADIDLAGEGLTNVPPCVANAYNAVWYAYTPPASVKAFSIGASIGAGSHADYNPSLAVYEGLTSAGLTLLAVVDGAGDTQTYCDNLTDGEDLCFYVAVPVTPGRAYWFQVVHEDGSAAPAGSILYLNAVKHTSVEAPIGSAVITDDSDGFRAAVLDIATGEILQYADIPAGEFSAYTASGQLCTQDGSADVAAVVLSPTLASVGSVSVAPLLIRGIWSNRADRFYIETHNSGSPNVTRQMLIVDAATATVLSTLDLALDMLGLCGAVSQDGTRFYVGRRATDFTDTVIDVYDLADGTLLDTWAVSVLNHGWFGGGKCGFALADGTICLPMLDIDEVTSVVLFSPIDGAVIQQWPSASGLAGPLNRMTYFDETECVVWANNAAGQNDPSYLVRLNLSTGARTVGGGFRVSGSSHLSPDAGVPFWVSNSCPLIVIPPGAPPLPPPDDDDPPPDDDGHDDDGDGDDDDVTDEDRDLPCVLPKPVGCWFPHTGPPKVEMSS